MEIINHHTKKSSLGHLREVVVYQRFKLKRFDWENVGVLNRGLHMVVFNCNTFSSN